MAKRSFVACEQCVTIASREFLSVKPGATTIAISSMASKAASTEAMSGGFVAPDVVDVSVVLAAAFALALLLVLLAVASVVPDVPPASVVPVVPVVVVVPAVVVVAAASEAG